MTDKDFIDKINDIMFNYGYILVDFENIDYYIKKFDNKYLNGFYIKFYKIGLFDIKNNSFKDRFISIDSIINDYKYIFNYIEAEIKYCGKKFTDEFIHFILNLKGNSKEEILLKLQMMGY